MVSFGYSIAVFNSTGELLSDKLSWGTDKALYVSMCQGAIPTGAFIGTFISGSLSVKIGKRKTIMLFQMVNIIGTAMFALGNTPIIIIGRLITGICMGSFMATSQNFASEISNIAMRKTGSVILSVMGFTGYLICCIMALGLPERYSSTDPMIFWLTFMPLFPIIVYALQILGFLVYFTNETPVWLLDQGMEKEYNAALEFIYYGGELEGMKKEIEGRKLLMDNEAPTLYEIFTEKKYVRMTFLSIMLMIFLQCTGINCLMFYSSKMFHDITDDVLFSRVYSICIAFVTVISCMLTSQVTKFFGRKTLIVWSFAGVSGLNILSGLVSQFSKSPAIPILIITMVLVFICICALSTVIWIYCMECLNIRILSTAATCSMLMNSILVILFPLARVVIEINYIFYFFGVISFIAFCYTSFRMIETSGLNKVQISEAFLVKDEVITIE